MDCSICMENIENNVNNARTECGHDFHVQCLIKWTRTTPNCPICRKLLIEPQPAIEAVNPNQQYSDESDVAYIARVSGQADAKVEQALRYYNGNVQHTLEVMMIDDQRHNVVPPPENVEDPYEFEIKRDTLYWIPPYKHGNRPRRYGREYVRNVRMGILGGRMKISRFRMETGILNEDPEYGYRST